MSERFRDPHVNTVASNQTKSDKPIDLASQPAANHNQIVTIHAQQGKATFLNAGNIIKVINTYGTQVVDTWAFNAANLREFMSMEHSRASMLKLVPCVGDTLVTNYRRAIVTVVEDTTPGVHDTLIAACDKYRYEQLGGRHGHENCSDNLASALHELGFEPPETPSPLNLFMNVAALEGGRIEFRPPVSEPGQYISLRAEMDSIIVFSACPQDITPVNALQPTDAHFVIL
jgi:uncharacterized protein YcgI (DUF1989 family)